MTERKDPVDNRLGNGHDDELVAETAIPDDMVDESIALDTDAGDVESQDKEDDAGPELAAVTEPEPEPVPEEIDPTDLHALAALALGIAPSVSDPDIRSLTAALPGLQRELAALMPVADILTSLYQAKPAAAPATPDVTPVVAPVERGRQPAADQRSRRVAPVTDRPTGSRALVMPKAIAGLSVAAAAGIAMAVIAAVAVLWALALLDRVATRDDEIAALREQVAQLRQAANASAFVLTPASDEAPDAGGTIFYSNADRTVLLDVSGLPQLEDEDSVYQIWFQSAGSNEWVLGPAFRVNRQGESIQRLAGDTPGFTRVAISREPAPGSPEPSGDFVLEGTLAGGNG